VAIANKFFTGFAGYGYLSVIIANVYSTVSNRVRMATTLPPQLNMKNTYSFPATQFWLSCHLAQKVFQSQPMLHFFSGQQVSLSCDLVFLHSLHDEQVSVLFLRLLISSI
jgi:hypothetical protein